MPESRSPTGRKCRVKSGTFSMKTTAGRTSSKMRMSSGHSARSSAWPWRRPATEYGWHGMPAQMQSTIPRQGRPSNVSRSDQTGAASKEPSSICAARQAAAKASLSTKQTVRASGTAMRIPRSRPPMPAHRESRLKAGTATSIFQPVVKVVRHWLRYVLQPVGLVSPLPQ